MLTRSMFAVAAVAAVLGGLCRAEEEGVVTADVSVKDASVAKTCRVLSEAYSVAVIADPAINETKITFDLRRAPISGVLSALNAAYGIKWHRMLVALALGEKIRPEEIADALAALQKIRASGLYVEGPADESAVSYSRAQTLPSPKPGDTGADGKTYREVYYLYTQSPSTTVTRSPSSGTTPAAARPSRATAVSAEVAKIPARVLVAPGGPGDQGSLFTRWFEAQPLDQKIATLSQLLAAALNDPKAGGELSLEVPRPNGTLRLHISNPSQE
jgi:hypothetical protein